MWIICLCVFVGRSMCQCLCVETRGKLWVSFLRDAIYLVIWDRCLLDLEPTKYIRLASHWTPGIPLFPLLRCWDYKYTPFHLLWGVWGQNFVPCYLEASALQLSYCPSPCWILKNSAGQNRELGVWTWRLTYQQMAGRANLSVLNNCRFSISRSCSWSYCKFGPSL